MARFGRWFGILSLLSGCSHVPNVVFPTLGGKQLWADETVQSGWRIQRHVWTGHCRLLNPGDLRYAWGTLKSCREALASRNDRLPTVNDRRVVVMVAGIFRSKDALSGLEAHFLSEGFDVINVNLPTCVWDLEDLAAQLGQILERSLGGASDVSFVTHSMGGLVVRKLIGEDAEIAGVPIRGCCMVFPPNQGAYLANRWHERWWYRWVMGPAGQCLTTAAATALPVPTIPVAVIAGGMGDDTGRSWLIPGDDDGTVAVSETYLPTLAVHEILPVGHTFGMNDARVVERIQQFLVEGR